ncbi:metallophosphoesterase [Alteribacter lacisalsi]|uniref:metallophosphoesterase n=1 Tax=Alteribacter lacisalsi TaxID=2045244 RepID=UPI001374EB82|nr:metallophosphoesterase [Alteribacter lacisalsi]
MLLISDIHRRKTDVVVKDHRSSDFDMVWIGGDLAEKGVPEERIRQNLEELSSLAPVYFVWGNNDYEGAAAAMESVLKEFGVTILRNSSVEFQEEGGSWTLAGVDDLTMGRPSFTRIEDGLSDIAVLLSHNPDAVRWFQTGRFTCAVSGHTHGGQIRLGPFGIAERGGWKYRNGMRLFISEGYGTTRLPLRLGTRSEYHILHICTDEQKVFKS